MTFIQPEKISFPYAWVGHLPFAMQLISQVQPKLLVELGTHTGNSYLAMCQAAKAENYSCQFYAVDTWEGDSHAGYYQNDIYAQLQQYHEPRYGSFSELMRMTFDEAVNQFTDNSIDLLHIDGLHTYEAVKHDFETWLPKLTQNAIVLFHDTAVKNRGFGVYQFWEEVTRHYPYHFAFDHSNGLGVLCLSKPSHPLLLSLIESSAQRYLFEQAGNRLIINESLHLINQQQEKIEQIEAQSKARIESLNNEINAMRQSKSWTITAPLRGLADWLRKKKITRATKTKLAQLSDLLRASQYMFSGYPFYEGKLNFDKLRYLAQTQRENKDYHAWIQRCENQQLSPNYYHDYSDIHIVILAQTHTLTMLRASIDSVIEQYNDAFQHQLTVIAPDALLDELVSHYSEEKYSKLTRLPVNTPLVLKQVIDLNERAFVLFINAGDLLAKRALSIWNKAIIEHPNAQILYSDEDCIDEFSIRNTPNFKSDFNFELFVAQNMFGQSVLYQNALLKQIETQTIEIDNTIWFALGLNSLSSCNTEQIIHVPHILLHKRVASSHRGGMIQHNSLKGLALLNQFLANRSDYSSATLIDHIGYRLHPSTPTKLPWVTLVIPTKNAKQLVETCINSILTITDYTSYDILLIDNGSDDPEALEYFQQLNNMTNISVIRDNRPFNYSALNNAAVTMAKGEIIGLINNDIEVINANWLKEMVAIAIQENVGAVGA